MKLKEKILLESIKLFNEFGVANISTKKISNSLEISEGNLNYYFKTKVDLISAILDKLIVDSHSYYEMDANATAFEFVSFITKFENLQLSYRFFFDDMIFISKKYPKIGGRFEKLTKERFENGRKMIDFFIQLEMIVPEISPINYDHLNHSIWIITTFWLPQNQVVKNNDLASKHSRVDIVLSLIYPYLTPKGVKEYIAFSKGEENFITK